VVERLRRQKKGKIRLVVDPLGFGKRPRHRQYDLSCGQPWFGTLLERVKRPHITIVRVQNCNAGRFYPNEHRSYRLETDLSQEPCGNSREVSRIYFWFVLRQTVPLPRGSVAKGKNA